MSNQMPFTQRTMEEFHNPLEMATTHTSTVSGISKKGVVQDLKAIEASHLAL